MATKPLFVAALGLLAIGAAKAPPAAAATPPGGLQACTTEQAKAVASYEAHVRAAKPGDPLFVPFPFPHADKEVIADYIQQWEDIFGRSSAKPIDSVQRIVDLVKANRVRYEVLSGEDWSPMRCDGRFPMPNWFLVRIYEITSGKEVSRAVISYTGIWANSANDQPGWPLKPLATAAAASTHAAGLQLAVKSPTFISLAGDICYVQVHPCIALNGATGDDLYIYSPAHLMYRVLPAQTFSPNGNVATPEKLVSVQRSLVKGQHLLSLGADSFAVVQQIDPP